LPVALARLAVPLILLALIPLIVKEAPVRTATCALVDANGWLQPVGSTVRNYLKNLGRLALMTIPLMIVAAFLGAVVAEVLPVGNIPATVSITGIIAIALIGTFLPVPMSFDVAIAFLLMAKGVPLAYVVTLLCTLGALSIYSVLILGRTISWRTAATIFGAVALLGSVAGMVTAVVQHSL
jgi:uncharacterized membrane protein YraQ (UPF0718 family)